MQILVVDAANVVGATPDGWWKDRAGAARRLHERPLTADLPHDEVVLVLEGKAKGGVRPGRDLHVRSVHAKASGDDAIVEEVRRAVARPAVTRVTVVTADRALRAGAEVAGADVCSPTWLLDRL